MKTSRPNKKLRRGMVSYVLVLTAGITLTLLTVAAYRRAMEAHTVQREAQVRVDYGDKEEAVLRALVNITPNRAVRAMQGGSNASSAVSNPLRWQNIFSDAMDQANARTSVSTSLVTQMNLSSTAIGGNATDAAFTDLSTTFDAIEPEPGYMSTGMNRSLGGGFPVPLEGSTSDATLDATYPIISGTKVYGSLANGKVNLSPTTYSKLNQIPYPNIRFGYTTPGSNFVAKRNWWAFSLQLGENDQILKSFSANGGSENERDFILSIYEIPSQLAISAEAFTNLGTHADGSAWQNTTITGPVYSTRAQVDSALHVDSLAARRGLSLGTGVTVGNTALGGNPMTPGVREQFEVTNGTFMPVSMGSEAGRAAFIPINRGADFFDRLAHATETNSISPTTWNNYSVGALQCAMRCDVTAVVSATNPTPTTLRFSYMNGTTRVNLNIPQGTPPATPTALQAGYGQVATEGGTYTGSAGQLYDVAYGASGKFYYKYSVAPPITFNVANFGDPITGTTKAGYARPASPFECKLLKGTKRVICVYPKRLPAFVGALGGSGPTVNNSLVMNVDYTVTGLNNPATYKPKIPCTDADYGVVMSECDNLTPFSKGFSLVTNLRLYIADDFNVVSMTPPTGLPSPFYPPASLFAPEKRYGGDYDPYKVDLVGQMGHLGGDSGSTGTPVRLLDVKMGSETMAAADKVNVNLKPITHPDELPPITMMNWLVTIEERRKAFYNADGTAK